MLFANITAAQKSISLGDIDDYVRSIEPAPPADLVDSLTKNYSTDLQKVRAIFSWIAEHIVYKTKKTVIKKSPMHDLKFFKPIDSVNVNSANEFVAETVIRNQSGVCEGYARLFKTLCDYAGIKSVLITGYARGDMYHVGMRFVSNHYWNAVFVDSAWHLIDVTWASGYFTYYGDEFVKHFDDFYFFTPPDLFIRDHFPDDLQWTLLPDPSEPEEFYYSPFKQRAFIKYNIIALAPSTGVLHVSVGDTIKFELHTADAVADKGKVTDTLSLDSTTMEKYSSVAFLQPAITDKRIRYTYIVSSENIKWLHLMYNNDVILCYKLSVKKRKQNIAGNN